MEIWGLAENLLALRCVVALGILIPSPQSGNQGAVGILAGLSQRLPLLWRIVLAWGSHAGGTNLACSCGAQLGRAELNRCSLLWTHRSLALVFPEWAHGLVVQRTKTDYFIQMSISDMPRN